MAFGTAPVPVHVGPVQWNRRRGPRSDRERQDTSVPVPHPRRSDRTEPVPVRATADIAEAGPRLPRRPPRRRDGHLPVLRFRSGSGHHRAGTASPDRHARMWHPRNRREPWTRPEGSRPWRGRTPPSRRRYLRDNQRIWQTRHRQVCPGRRLGLQTEVQRADTVIRHERNNARVEPARNDDGICFPVSEPIRTDAPDHRMGHRDFPCQ